MTDKKKDKDFSKVEAQKRFEAALRGARVTGPKPKSGLKNKDKPAAAKESTRKHRV